MNKTYRSKPLKRKHGGKRKGAGRPRTIIKLKAGSRLMVICKEVGGIVKMYDEEELTLNITPKGLRLTGPWGEFDLDLIGGRR